MKPSFNVMSSNGEVMLGSCHEDMAFAQAYCSLLNATEQLRSVIEPSLTSYHVVRLGPNVLDWIKVDVP